MLTPFDVRVADLDHVQYGSDDTKTHRKIKHILGTKYRDRVGRLLVSELFTVGQGGWSGFPPHKHDTDNYPNETYLEETYYHRLNPPRGFGFQRVYTEDGTLDETMAIGDGDVVLVPKGFHPVAAPHGFDLYYLNVMAGPKKSWKFTMSKDHAHIGWTSTPAR